MLGRLDLVASGALPAPSAILVRFWADRADYPAHVWATLQASTLGFLVGNAVAVLAGVAVRAVAACCCALARGINIAIFALPPIAIAPILVLTLQGMAPRVVLAALGCLLRDHDRDGDRPDSDRPARRRSRARLRRRTRDGAAAGAAARRLPAILSGCGSRRPNAVLGAILAEFGGGGRWGLGAYLLGSLGRADPARLWGIGLVATLIAGASLRALRG